FFFQAEDGIRDFHVTGVQTCALPIFKLRQVAGGKPMIARVIINADDFGLSSEENHTIISAFEQNLISSATLMANMPGFVEACELTRQHRLQGKIGLHFNLTYGRPLSQPIQRSEEHTSELQSR